MGGMSMGGNSCKISVSFSSAKVCANAKPKQMLWNWYTIDACFLSPSWHIKSHGAFAATCIGIAALVVVLEFFRRIGKEYDALIVRQYKRNLAAQAASTRTQSDASCEDHELAYATFRATPHQQMVRAVLHAVVFGLAYIVMLLAMYYNGYIIISIIMGAGIGKFLCDWMVVKIPLLPAQTDGSGKNIDHTVDEPR